MNIIEVVSSVIPADLVSNWVSFPLSAFSFCVCVRVCALFMQILQFAGQHAFLAILTHNPPENMSHTSCCVAQI